ncbi:mitotic checkpoint regulator, MAD2B-interacting-domain-containing protein [Cladochytrium replicatum]|nr:mitotic checkpoint regulator, MAD2B-interacting-domain-containing protein [Cladochytrium replicatum]
MDLLASYASDSDNDELPPAKRHAPSRPSGAQSQSSASATVSSLLATLPKPVAGGKKVFRVELPTAKEDQDTTDGKAKGNGGDSGVKKKLSWLPAPKNAGTASTTVSRESLLMLPSVKAKAKQPESNDSTSSAPNKDTSSSVNESVGDPEESFFTIEPQQAPKPYGNSLSSPSSSSTFAKQAPPPSTTSSTAAAHPSSMYSYVGPSMPPTEAYDNAYPEAEDLEEPTHTIPADVDFAMIEKLGGAKAFRKGAAELEIQDISFEEQLSDQWQYEGLRHKRGLGMTGAVRPGKMDRKRHSLMSLVHEAQSRRDELEDAYAQRRMNKKTNSMKYGF